MDHVKSRRRFQANPNIDNALHFIAEVTRSQSEAAKAEDLIAILRRPSARHWNLIWAFVDANHSDQQPIDSALIDALNVCLEDWPTRLRVLPPTHYLRFSKIQEESNVAQRIPGMHLIRSLDLNGAIWSHELDVHFITANQLSRHCPNIHSANYNFCDEIWGFSLIYENFSNIPVGLKTIELSYNYDSADIAGRVFSDPDLHTLEKLEIQTGVPKRSSFKSASFRQNLRELILRTGAAEEDEFNAHLPRRAESTARRNFRETWLRDVLQLGWPKLQSLTLLERAFVDQNFNCVEQILALPALKQLHFEANDQRSLSSLTKFRSAFPENLNFEIVTNLQIDYDKSFNLLSHDNKKTLGQLSELSLFINGEVPEAQELELLSSLNKIQLTIVEETAVTKGSRLNRTLKALQQAKLSDKVYSLHLNLNSYADLQHPAIIEAIQSYELKNLETLNFRCFEDEASHYSIDIFIASLMQCFKSESVQSLTLCLDSLTLKQFMSFEVAKTLSHLHLRVDSIDERTLNHIFSQFAENQLKIFELQRCQLKLATILKNSNLNGIEKLGLRTANLLDNEALEILASGNFSELEHLNIGAHADISALQTLLAGGLPSLLQLQYIEY